MCRAATLSFSIPEQNFAPPLPVEVFTGVWCKRGEPAAPLQAPASRQGWPYERRTCRRACGATAYSRATPGGWPASRSHGLKLTLMGVALLYTTAFQAARAARIE